MPGSSCAKHDCDCSKVRDTLRHDLRRTVELLDQSEESDWTPFAPDEVAADLRGAIASIEKSAELPDRDRIIMHFAVSGAIQEIAIGASGRSSNATTPPREYVARPPPPVLDSIPRPQIRMLAVLVCPPLRCSPMAFPR